MTSIRTKIFTFVTTNDAGKTTVDRAWDHEELTISTDGIALKSVSFRLVKIEDSSRYLDRTTGKAVRSCRKGWSQKCIS